MSSLQHQRVASSNEKSRVGIKSTCECHYDCDGGVLIYYDLFW